jgi:hypothetical protein
VCGAARLLVWHSCCQREQQRRRFIAVCACEEDDAMDIGITKSNKRSPFHFITGMFVVTVSYSVVMFAVRVYIVGV